jgi:hypothetical protein
MYVSMRQVFHPSSPDSNILVVLGNPQELPLTCVDVLYNSRLFQTFNLKLTTDSYSRYPSARRRSSNSGLLL